ncbi:hypothetical protein RQY88_004323 [Vibrio vulnificus]|uniref:hypothetical protein n=1 Tax=Vibrio cholerae TaxID=666 RepID=UPI0028939D13|nr:hypothetical protein [Vibrio vulnificus]ELH9602881.1 hypothetical protein [Vibrio vulnificus]ELH9617339.1 hypothetical protein [Vibrio vulnificus]
MESPTVENLKVLTQEFFSLHWNAVLLGSDCPEWSDIYEFTGSMPNHNKQGVYAFVKSGVVTYIGVGASSNGTGRYAGHGLGKRFQSYSKVVDGRHVPTDPRLVDAGAMITIGFKPEQSYLAYALEMFLIGKMSTEHNINRPSK